MRQFKNGLLKPDCFAHKRLLTFPPACRVFLVMFNRFHNYVVEQLARFVSSFAETLISQTDIPVASTKLIASKNRFPHPNQATPMIRKRGSSMTRIYFRLGAW
jgi:hypothetical protein